MLWDYAQLLPINVDQDGKTAVSYTHLDVYKRQGVGWVAETAIITDRTITPDGSI